MASRSTPFFTGLVLAACLATGAAAQQPPVSLQPPARPAEKPATPKPPANPTVKRAEAPKPKPDAPKPKPKTAPVAENEEEAAPAKPGKPQAKLKTAGAGSGHFEAFLAKAKARALAEGISQATIDRAFAGLSPDPAIILLTRKQAEFVKPIWSYIAGSVSPERIARGRAMLAAHADVLANIEARFGVPKEIVLGVWGMETNYGSFTGGNSVIRSLATLAFARYREDFFLDELIVALRILDEGHVEIAAMRGSWAGAMGHTQFMPSSYMKYAVSYSGRGHGDIWRSVPDALASTANYLKEYKWVRGAPWGIEVTLPESIDLSRMRRDFGQWAAAGVQPAGDVALPSRGEARLFLPAGIRGPAFLVTDNYDVIKSYNQSDAYALGVAFLGDRIMGRSPLAGSWPTKEKQLSKGEREEVQRRLRDAKLYTGKIDGKLGTGTRDALQRFQLSVGYKPADGYANPPALARLRKGS